MKDPKKMKKWLSCSGSVVYKNRLFRIRKERCVIPRTGKPYDYYYEDAPDWVNIVARTDRGNILLVRQYRHAVKDFTIEIPGGVIDKADKNPLQAAKRELLEETGFAGGRFRLIGLCHPNTAIMNNKTYVFFADKVKRKGEPSPDPTEEIEVMEKSFLDIERLIKKGKITHTLVISAIYFAKQYLK